MWRVYGRTNNQKENNTHTQKKWIDDRKEGEKKAVGKVRVETNEIWSVERAAGVATPRPAPPASPTCFIAFYNWKLQRPKFRP